MFKENQKHRQISIYGMVHQFSARDDETAG